MRQAAVLGILAVVVSLLVGCNSEPFPMVKASGKLVYEDGSPLPTKKGDMLGLIFIPLMPPKDPKTHARMGTASVNPEDGTFSSATSHKWGDGLVRGKYKVSIYTGDKYSPAVPREYCDPDTTPLEVDASKQPMVIAIKKPK